MWTYLLNLLRRAPRDFREKAEFFTFWGPVAIFLLVLVGVSLPNWKPTELWAGLPAAYKVASVFVVIVYELLWLSYRMYSDVTSRQNTASAATKENRKQLRTLLNEGQGILDEWLQSGEIDSLTSIWQRKVKAYFDEHLPEETYELGKVHKDQHRSQSDPQIQYQLKEKGVNAHIDTLENLRVVIRKLGSN